MPQAQKKHTIVGVHITDRVKHAESVQKLFTAYGCQIKTRLGLHDADESYCSPNGLVILEVVGPDKETDALIKGLKKIKGVDARKMVFPHA